MIFNGGQLSTVDNSSSTRHSDILSLKEMNPVFPRKCLLLKSRL